MEPVSALALAGNIIQLVDFSTRILSRSKELYKSVDGQTAEHALLENAAQNLSDLSADLGTHTGPNISHLTKSDKILLKLKHECQDTATELREALQRAKLKRPRSKWESLREAVTITLGDEEVEKLSLRFESLRKELDTTILLSLR